MATTAKKNGTATTAQSKSGKTENSEFHEFL